MFAVSRLNDLPFTLMSVTIHKVEWRLVCPQVTLLASCGLRVAL